MSVYTVRTVSEEHQADSILADRGLKAKAVTLPSLGALGVAEYPQIAYKLYTKLLPAFMLANISREEVPTTRSGYNLIVQWDDLIQLRFPPLAASFSQALNAEEIEALTQSGAAIIPNKKHDHVIYTWGPEYVGRTLLDNLLRHKKQVIKLCNVPVGALNIQQFFMYIRAVGMITAFLRTQVYPAFSGPMEGKSLEGGAFDTIDGLVGGKRKGNFEERAGKFSRTDRNDDDDDEDMADGDDAMGMMDFSIGDAASKIPKARPSPPVEAIFGSPSEIPTLPGLIFPYFDDMIKSDNNFVAEIVREHFLDCLGNTREEIRKIWPAFKGGIGAVGNTKVGKILQHIYLGARLAIETQSRLFIVANRGEYVGFSLHGWYFTVNIDNRQFAPVAYDELIVKARVIDEHAVAVATILLRLSKLKIDGKRPTKAAMGEGKELARTAGGLAEFIRRFSLEDEAEAEEIEKLATKLSFPQRFKSFTAENILGAVGLLLEKNFPTSAQPQYTRGGVLTSKDPSVAIFAQFGESGFSFLTPGGIASKIPKDHTSDLLFKPYVKKGKTITPSPVIVVTKKSIRLCVEDWNSFLEKKAIYQKKTRDASYRSTVLTAGEAKALWFGLIDRIGPLVGQDESIIRADEIGLEGNEANDAEDEEDYSKYL